MIKTPIENSELKAHLASLPEDGRDIYLLQGGEARVTVVSANTIINQMRANHKTGLLETYVLGQGYIAGLLLTSTIKGNDRLILQVECGGPIKGMSIEAWAVGAVRGYLINNPIPLEKPLTSLDTSLLYGPGFLSITKLLEGAKEPVSGTVMLQYGNLAKDLALYFQESEQNPTLFYISINFDNNGNVMGAGGLFIQAMPGCSDKLLEDLQEKAKKLPDLGAFLSSGKSASEYVEEEFKDFKPEKLAHCFAAFSCPCTREHFSGYLENLPQKEKEEIMKGSFPLNLECFNCGSTYSFTESEVKTLFKTEEK